MYFTLKLKVPKNAEIETKRRLLFELSCFVALMAKIRLSSPKVIKGISIKI